MISLYNLIRLKGGGESYTNDWKKILRDSLMMLLEQGYYDPNGNCHKNSTKSQNYMFVLLDCLYFMLYIQYDSIFSFYETSFKLSKFN
jgi:hypothetical protein